MSDLRTKLIEAGARALERVANDDEADQVTWPEMVEVGLDAFLDYLAEHADEWAEETRVPTLVGGDALALIAVLREDL